MKRAIAQSHFSFAMVVSGVRCFSGRYRVEHARSFSPRDDRVAFAARFEDESALRAGDRIANDFLAFGRSDFFVGDDRETHGCDRIESDALGDRAKRIRDDDEPAFHVEHAGTAREISIATKSFERSRRKHGVEVTDKRDRIFAASPRVENTRWSA